MNDAKWIWAHPGAHPDEYVRFYQDFESMGGKIAIELSCDSNYELYVNGQLAGFGQYADYPYHKVYDRIDLTPYCQTGKNAVSILVWYFGKTALTYYKGMPGLIYEISENDNVIAYSSVNTLCKKATEYVSGKQKIITYQLGFSYTYDATGDNGETRANFLPVDYSHAIELSDRPEMLYPRPNQKILLKPFAPAVPICRSPMIYDLGQETVGYLGIGFQAPKGATVTVSYGEHLVTDENGAQVVPRRIGNRDFSVELIGNGERVTFSNYMRRMGCRYLQVDCEDMVTIEQIGLHPAEYPLTVKTYHIESALRQRIYDTCVKTLRFCMFEHYEDCPWREQALYTMDSRNQMLCGYYAFGEYAFARASLDLMGQDRREDNLLHITFPSDEELVIPSFSLHWLQQMREYAEFSKDVSLIQTYYAKMNGVLEAFLARKENGVISNFYGEKRYWNFYEWQPNLQGSGENGREKSFDLVLNALLSFALGHMAAMADLIGRKEDAVRYCEEAQALNLAINRVFWSEERALYLDRPDRTHTSALGNSLAVLCGAAKGERARQVCERILNDAEIVPTTLSMRAFLYDALLITDRDLYASYILCDIDASYGYMLDCGATSFWETAKGAADFGNAGSLCHGWSAIPIVYYNKLSLYMK